MQLLLHIFPRPFDFRLPRLILDNFHFFFLVWFGLVWFDLSLSRIAFRLNSSPRILESISNFLEFLNIFASNVFIIFFPETDKSSL